MIGSDFKWGLKQAKSAFFDRDSVKKKLDMGMRRVLSRAGAFVRRRAKSSIRKRKKASPPGSPPSSHTGVLKDFIFFAYDDANKSVVIGPTKTNQKNAFGRGGKTVPGVLETGGIVGMHEHLVESGKYKGQWIRSDLRYRRAGPLRSMVGRDRRIRNAMYEPRPYMGPAGRSIEPLLRMWLRGIMR